MRMGVGLGLGFAGGGGGAPPLFDTDAQAYFDAVVAAGGSVSAGRKTLLNTLITGLKTNGTWSKRDRLWVFAAENSQSALVDLKARSLATVTAAPTFTVDQGYAGNGSSSYVNTGFLPSTGVQMTLNAHHVTVYVRTSRTTADASTVVGAQTTTPSTVEVAIYPRFTGNVVHMRAGDAAAAGPNQTNAQGCWTINRSGASAKEWYKNAASFSTTGVAAVALPAFALYVGAKNNSGTAGQFSSDQFALLSVGGSLSGAEIAADQTVLEAYLDAIGAGVLP